MVMVLGCRESRSCLKRFERRKEMKNWAALCRRASVAVFLSLLAFSAATYPSGATQPATDECLDCHGSDDILGWSEEEVLENTLPAKKLPKLRFVKIPDISSFVDEELYAASVHGDLSCNECHVDADAVPHNRYLKAVFCGECHEEAEGEYGKSRHGLSRERDKVVFAPGCSDCHGAHYVSEISFPESPVYFNNLATTCGRCHGNREFVKAAGISMKEASALYEQSIHGRAISQKGLSKAANCVDCHGSHDLLRSGDPGSSVFRRNIPETCGKCHYGIYSVYVDSVHGAAAKKGLPDAPVCTDCHGEHEIEPALEATSYVSPLAISTTTCPSCHDAQRIVRKFGIDTDRTRSYEDTYHGLAMKMRDHTVANCASCHGAHEIYPSSDRRSTVFAGNLKITCGKCHPKATEKFAVGTIHGGGTGTGELVKKIVKYFYIWLIVLTIGFMLAHNTFDYVKKLRVYLRKHKKEPRFERMNRIERFEHFLMIISFFGLVITGFALKFSWSIPFLKVGVNEFLRSFLHRVFAIVMVGVCLHHLGYLLFDARGRKLFVDMLPRYKDVKDMLQAIKYYVGLAKERPAFDRFGYIEKLEYFALIWGSIVMILTGFILWFEEESMILIPMWGIDVATIIHYYEAILATLAIIVWHLYFVIINPDVAPMSFTWIDGTISRHHMELEHPLELQKLDGGGEGE
jgi:cytochrome b subunit of formate dehydrogenase